MKRGGRRGQTAREKAREKALDKPSAAARLVPYQTLRFARQKSLESEGGIPLSPDIRKALQSAWIHSHEEDEGARLVFRGPDSELPPSRGRTAFTLKPDGVVEVVGPGPDDRRRATSGRWTLAATHLDIRSPGFSGAFEVETVDAERLVIRRVREEK